MNGTVPETMRAAYIDAVGPADAIRYGELPVPSVGPTDVLVRVSAVAADPVDTFVRSGAYATSLPTPFVVGRDLVGEVAATGPGAAGLAVGQRVWCNSLGHGGRQGSFAQYATVAAERLYPVPAGVDEEHLVAAAHPAASAWLALFRHGRLRAGETVYVGGGAGNVGGAAVSLAARAGARVVATARARDAEAVRELGAAEVLDHHAPDLGERLRAAAPDGYDVHLDTSGRGVLADAVESLARGGRLVAMVGLGSGPAALPVSRLYTRDASIVGFAISNATTADLDEAARGVVGVLTRTPWRPRIADRLPLSRTAEAHRRLEAGRVRGRLVLTPS
ncbi:NADPH:quinone reductase [Streptomyces sp. NA03103]|uniref:NADPH:quinone reductase n=1 Tax=Streptomyces sp. NA03103 TaxID=2742134 RepID=UPI0015917754|nr:NADPH:quinone reductase [Streptomyces sp. NA03103]QKW59500.1 NADPH:quinone reductase [Streptomyces sp. NA03103]